MVRVYFCRPLRALEDLDVCFIPMCETVFERKQQLLILKL